MKQFTDFIPLLIFFVCYKIYDLKTATAVFIAASALALIVNYIKHRKVEKTPLFMFVLIAVFGTLTIIYDNLEFIQYKVTIVYGIFAIALLFSQIILKKNLIQKMLEKDITLPSQIWGRINIAWVLFFIFCGAANLYVAFHYSNNTWFIFKVFGTTGLTLLFTLLSGVYIYKHLPKEKKPNTDEIKKQ